MEQKFHGQSIGCRTSTPIFTTQGQGAGSVATEGTPRRVRLDRDVATHCPGLVFGAHSTKISAFPAYFGRFAKPLEDKGDLALFSSRFGLVPGAGMEFSVDSGRS